jgi:tetratricopeptide (TPR) repeat protein
MDKGAVHHPLELSEVVHPISVLATLGPIRHHMPGVRTRDPENVGAFPVLIYLDLMEGRYEAAEELIEELLSREPPVEVINSSNFFSYTALGYVYLKTGRSREGRRLLELARDKKMTHISTGSGYVGHYDLARIYAMLEDPEQAVHWLQVAIDRGWPFYYTKMGRTDPMLENLRGARTSRDHGRAQGEAGCRA